MSQYKKVKIPKKNLPESIDSKQFKSIWIKSFNKDPESILLLFQILEDFFLFVKESLRNFYNPNYFLVSLLCLIDASPSKAISKLKLWLIQNDVVYESKVLIFQRLNNIKKIPKKSRPIMAEYYFVLDFKYALSKEIKKIKFNKNTYIPINCEYNYIKEPILNLTTWQKYLLKLFSLGYSNSEISQITELSRKTIINERKKLYVYVKNSSNERS